MIKKNCIYYENGRCVNYDEEIECKNCKNFTEKSIECKAEECQNCNIDICPERDEEYKEE